MIPGLDVILAEIPSLSLKDVLAHLAALGIKDVSKTGYEKVRAVIREKVNERKYGFSPTPNEHNILSAAAERQFYQEFNGLISNKHYCDLIRVGYLVSHLNRAGSPANRERVKSIQDKICNRPNGIVQWRIVQIVTTGAIESLVNYLNQLKRDNFDQKYVDSAFDDFVNDWQKYTFFAKTDMPETIIIETMKNRINARPRVLMVFAYGSAKKPTTGAVSQVWPWAATQGYVFWATNSREGDKDVHVSTFTLAE